MCAEIYSHLLLFWISTLNHWLKLALPCDSPAQGFLRFASSTCIFFEFWLAHCIVCVLYNWLVSLVLVLQHSIETRTNTEPHPNHNINNIKNNKNKEEKKKDYSIRNSPSCHNNCNGKLNNHYTKNKHHRHRHQLIDQPQQERQNALLNYSSLNWLGFGGFLINKRKRRESLLVFLCRYVKCVVIKINFQQNNQIVYYRLRVVPLEFAWYVLRDSK